MGPNLKLFNATDIWECKRTGQCCRLFVFTGVQVSKTEWRLLEKDIKLLNLPRKEFEKCKSQLTLPLRGKKMNLFDIPFTKLGPDDFPRPWLPIEISLHIS